MKENFRSTNLIKEETLFNTYEWCWQHVYNNYCLNLNHSSQQLCVYLHKIYKDSSSYSQCCCQNLNIFNGFVSFHIYFHRLLNELTNHSNSSQHWFIHSQLNTVVIKKLISSIIFYFLGIIELLCNITLTRLWAKASMRLVRFNVNLIMRKVWKMWNDIERKIAAWAFSLLSIFLCFPSQ